MPVSKPAQPPGWQQPEFGATLKFTGWPIKNESMVVQNPKEIAQKGMLNIPKLKLDIESTMLDMISGSWFGGESEDAALAYGPAIFLLQQSVEHMDHAKTLGLQEEQEEEEEERKRKQELIVTIISVVLVVRSHALATHSLHTSV